MWESSFISVWNLVLLWISMAEVWNDPVQTKICCGTIFWKWKKICPTVWEALTLYNIRRTDGQDFQKGLFIFSKAYLKMEWKYDCLALFLPNSVQSMLLQVSITRPLEYFHDIVVFISGSSWFYAQAQAGGLPRVYCPLLIIQHLLFRKESSLNIKGAVIILCNVWGYLTNSEHQFWRVMPLKTPFRLLIGFNLTRQYSILFSHSLHDTLQIKPSIHTLHLHIRALRNGLLPRTYS
jgi:hypothetical protein